MHGMASKNSDILTCFGFYGNFQKYGANKAGQIIEIPVSWVT
jgi:hypothetical protein